MSVIRSWQVGTTLLALTTYTAALTPTHTHRLPLLASAHPTSRTPLPALRDGRPSGRRVGGTPPPPAPEPPAGGQARGSLAAPAVALGAAVLLVLSSLRGPMGGVSYSFSSYSTTIVRKDGGNEPSYETKRSSSFQSNVPGLAERMAERENAAGGAFVLPFPF